MRVLFFFLYQCFLLLGIGHNVYAGMEQHVLIASAQTPEGKAFVKFSATDESLTLIDESDSDTEEEFVSSGDTEENGHGKYFNDRFFLQNKWCATYSACSMRHHDYKKTTTYLCVCSHSSPIYIQIRTLKIWHPWNQLSIGMY